MEPTQAADPNLLAHYEGLVIKTGSMYAPILKGWDFEDICQVLRVKIWKALLHFEPDRYAPHRVEKARDSFIFGCVRNEVKDLVKRQKEQALLIEDVAPAHTASAGPFQQGPRDRFEQRYLQVSPEEVFEGAEDGALLLPSTLTPDERLVLLHMYIGFSQTETAIEMGIDRQKVTTIVKRIRRKMADWRPSPQGSADADAALVPVAA